MLNLDLALPSASSRVFNVRSVDRLLSNKRLELEFAFKGRWHFDVDVAGGCLRLNDCQSTQGGFLDLKLDVAADCFDGSAEFGVFFLARRLQPFSDFDFTASTLENGADELSTVSLVVQGSFSRNWRVHSLQNKQFISLEASTNRSIHSSDDDIFTSCRLDFNLLVDRGQAKLLEVDSLAKVGDALLEEGKVCDERLDRQDLVLLCSRERYTNAELGLADAFSVTLAATMMFPLGRENANAFAISLGNLADLGDIEELRVAITSRDLDIDLPSVIVLRLLEFKIPGGQRASRDEEEVGRRVQSEVASRMVREITLGFFPAHTFVQLDIVRDGIVRWRMRVMIVVVVMVMMGWRATVVVVVMVGWTVRMRMRAMTAMVMVMTTPNKTQERLGGRITTCKEPKSDKR